MSTTQVETVIVPTAAETATIHTVGDSVVLTVEDLAAFLPSLKGSVSSNVNAILSRYGYTPEKPTAPVKAPKKEKAAKAAVTVPECPATEGVPTAADYRLAPEAINYSLCLGRMQQGAEDKRWSPFVYREYQCSKSPAEGITLCKMCSDRHEKFVATGKRGQWCGFINQAPPDWWHMLGTKWAEDKQPKFNGATVVTAVPAATVEVAAETAVQEQAMTTTAAPAPTKEAAKVTKAAEKEAAKAAKEAEKAAAKAAKEAEKEAAKAVKEAEKAAKKAAAPKKAAAKKTETVATAPTEVVPAKADVTAEVAKTDGDVQLINGEMYLVNNGNVYEYDELTQKPGDFVGRLRADRTIDGDAEEVSADESDSE